MNKNILILDDDYQIREGLQFFLEIKNYVVFAAKNNNEALMLIKKEKIDYAIIDLCLRVDIKLNTEGLSFFLYLFRYFPKTKIIILSSYPFEVIQDKINNINNFDDNLLNCIKKNYLYKGSGNFIDIVLNKLSLLDIADGRYRSVFISYASEDRIFAQKLAKDLSYIDVKVWIDVSEIKVGNSITEEINDAINKSDFFIVILSSSFSLKSWTNRELNAAIMKQASSNQPYILPVVIDNNPQIPGLISDIAFADFSASYDAAFNDLLVTIFEE